MSKKTVAEFTEMVARIREEGRAEGYAEGFKAATRKIKAFASAMSDGAVLNAGIKFSAQKAATAAQQKTTRRPRANSDQSKVLAVIQEHPGLKGSEIALFLSQMPEPVHERTMRTALNRLKGKLQIEQKEGVWYPRQSH